MSPRDVTNSIICVQKKSTLDLGGLLFVFFKTAIIAALLPQTKSQSRESRKGMVVNLGYIGMAFGFAIAFTFFRPIDGYIVNVYIQAAN